MSATGRIPVIGLVALALLCGCERRKAVTKTDAGASFPSASTTGVTASSAVTSASARGLVRGELRSADPALAIETMEAKIATMRRKLRANDRDLGGVAGLIAGLTQRATALGTMADYDEIAELGERVVQLHPKAAKAFQARAQARATVHRFREALGDLDRAEELGLSAADTGASRGSILVGLGRYDEALPLLEQAMRARPTSASISMVAMCLGHMLRVEEAERRFVEAEAAARYGSPVGVAWLYFHRGAMWDRAGNDDKARKLYRAALDHFPAYAHAVGHLANLMPSKQAEPLLVEVMKTSDDPEHRAALGAVRNVLEPGSGDELIEQAKRGYQALMKKHPAAFADHAGWFWLAIAKDPHRAVEVAALNLEARRVPAAFELAIAAQLAAGDVQDACDVAEQALAQRYAPVSVKSLAADAFERCGKREQARLLRAELPKMTKRHRH
jgi:tetratricopeptide (TPR) repeat protein